MKKLITFLLLLFCISATAQSISAPVCDSAINAYLSLSKNQPWPNLVPNYPASHCGSWVFKDTVVGEWQDNGWASESLKKKYLFGSRPASSAVGIIHLGKPNWVYSKWEMEVDYVYAVWNPCGYDPSEVWHRNRVDRNSGKIQTQEMDVVYEYNSPEIPRNSYYIVMDSLDKISRKSDTGVDTALTSSNIILPADSSKALKFIGGGFEQYDSLNKFIYSREESNGFVTIKFDTTQFIIKVTRKKGKIK